MDQEERRTNERHTIWVEAKIIVPDGEILSVITDLSTKGLGIRSSRVVAPGTRASIRPQLEGGMVFQGEVVWEILNRKDSVRYHQMGVHVQEIRYGDGAEPLPDAQDSPESQGDESFDLVKSILSMIEVEDGELTIDD